MENLYDILEVSKKASKEVIEKAYKTLAKKYHPDLQLPENKKNAEEMMKKINEAYSILSDEQKRAEYDRKLEAEEASKYNQNNNQNYTYTNENYNSNNYYNNNSQNNTSNYYNAETSNSEWQNNYQKLDKKEQEKLRKNLEKEANLEYRKQYEDYLRSLGYRVKHRWTLKDILTIFFVIAIFIIIFLILWVIPFTHDWMLNLYEENVFVNVIVKVFIGIFKGFWQFVYNIFNR